MSEIGSQAHEANSKFRFADRAFQDHGIPNHALHSMEEAEESAEVKAKRRDKTISTLLARLQGSKGEIAGLKKEHSRRAQELSVMPENNDAEIAQKALMSEALKLQDMELNGAYTAEQILTGGVDFNTTPPKKFDVLNVSVPSTESKQRFSLGNVEVKKKVESYSAERLRAAHALEALSRLYKVPAGVRTKFSPEGQAEIFANLSKGAKDGEIKGEQHFATDVDGLEIVFRIAKMTNEDRTGGKTTYEEPEIVVQLARKRKESVN